MRPTAKWPGPELTGLAAALFLGTVAPAGAEGVLPAQSRTEPPCVLDKCLQDASGTPQRPSHRDEAQPSAPPQPESVDRDAPRGTAVAPGQFDFYVLSLSWSPGFCETTGAAQGRAQCEPGTRLGFVVHGLWPQNAHGYPSNCSSDNRAPSRSAIQDAATIYPDEGLARHEWRMHGTCTGLSPTDYFGAVRRARAAITIPAALQSPDDARTWSPIEIARAFTEANPRLRTDTMSVTCRANLLEEVRICFSKDLRGFVSCPEVARASCRRPIEVPPVL